MKLAPIVIFTYNRPLHFKKTLDSLSHNELAKFSDVFIFIDGPKSIQDVDDVNSCLDVANSASGFKSVSIEKSTNNLGLSKSVISGLNKMFNVFETCIILEDDLIVSKFFLNFMNDGLDIYSESEEVCSIHGYMYPHDKELPETFFLRGADCWGWATWRKYWRLFEEDGEKLLTNLNKSGELHNFDYFGRSGNVNMLKNQIKGVADSWAIRWHASMYLHRKFTLYPNHSLIQNIGFDMSGTSKNNTKIFDTRLSDNKIRIVNQNVKPSLEAIQVLNEFYFKNNSKVFQVGTYFKNLLMRLRNAIF
jgi:hypothetical protein